MAEVFGGHGASSFNKNLKHEGHEVTRRKKSKPVRSGRRYISMNRRSGRKLTRANCRASLDRTAEGLPLDCGRGGWPPTRAVGDSGHEGRGTPIRRLRT